MFLAILVIIILAYTEILAAICLDSSNNFHGERFWVLGERCGPVDGPKTNSTSEYNKQQIFS